MNHFNESYLRHKLPEPSGWEYASNNNALPTDNGYNAGPTVDESYLRHKLPEPPDWEYVSTIHAQPTRNDYSSSIITDDTAPACPASAEENMTDAEYLAAINVPPGATNWILEPPEGAGAYDCQRSSNDYGTGLTHKDWDAACALVDLQHESMDTFRGYIRRHDGDMEEANKEFRQDIKGTKPSEPTRVRQKAAVPKEMQETRDRNDAALTLIKLSGQCRTDARAVFALMRLKDASEKALRNEELTRQNEERKKVAMPLAQSAIKKKNAVNRFLARHKIDTETRHDLRGTKDGRSGDLRNGANLVEEET